MRFVFAILAFWPVATWAQRQPPNEETVVKCSGVTGLSESTFKHLGDAIRCRIDDASLRCGPGLTLVRDSKRDQDICHHPDGRAIQAPRCIARNAQIYKQKIVERGMFTVDRNDGTTRVEKLDLPFSYTGRKEVLAQSKPINRPGVDGCVYLRRLVIVHEVHQPLSAPNAPDR